jgi:hypothetical protein
MYGGEKMSLTHEFFLISLEEDLSENSYLMMNLGKWKNDKVVVLHDDIITYIFDSLKWIPTINPSTQKLGYGLNYHGISIINSQNSHDGSVITRNIFNTWADLFVNSPEKLLLKGQFSWIDGDISKGKYEYLEYDRDEIINTFRTIALFADQVRLNNLQILHIGI